MSKFTINPIALAMSQSVADLEAADVWFAEKVAEGFTSETAGITLGLTESDVTLLTGNFVLAKEAAALELAVPPIIGSDGTVVALSIAELSGLMLEYGSYRAGLSAQYAQKRADAQYEPPQIETDEEQETTE